MSVSDDVLMELILGIESAAGQLGATRLVCIDGPAGSGKTTLAAQIAPLLPAQVIHMDDLYPGWTGLEAGVERLHEWVLGPLSTGTPGRYRRYDWGLGTYAERHSVPLADFLIVEGCGAAASGVDAYAPFIVWVEADDDVRLARGLERDGAAAEPLWRQFMVDEREHFAANRTRERADVRVDGFGAIADRA